MQEPSQTVPRFAIFRASEAVPFEEAGLMTAAMPSPVEIEGGQRLAEAGYEQGHRLKLLFAAPGLSLTHVWFKSGFPLPRHSHDADCLYYIIAGTLRMGATVLGAGDGFLVGKDVPYAYVPGDAGVELLEFRTTDSFDIKMMADNPAFWAKALETVVAKQAVWPEEAMPS